MSTHTPQVSHEANGRRLSRVRVPTSGVGRGAQQRSLHEQSIGWVLLDVLQCAPSKDRWKKIPNRDFGPGLFFLVLFVCPAAASHSSSPVSDPQRTRRTTSGGRGGWGRVRAMAAALCLCAWDWIPRHRCSVQLTHDASHPICDPIRSDLGSLALAGPLQSLSLFFSRPLHSTPLPPSHTHTPSDMSFKNIGQRFQLRE